MEANKPFDLLGKYTATHVNMDDQPDHKHAVLLGYEVQDPAAVELIFIPELISWKFSRDLLVTAAIQGAPAGEGAAGDVVIQPGYGTAHGNHLLITFRGALRHDGPSLPPEDFILDRRSVQKFLYATMDLVPLGEEDYSAEIDIALSLMRSVE